MESQQVVLEASRAFSLCTSLPLSYPLSPSLPPLLATLLTAFAKFLHFGHLYGPTPFLPHLHRDIRTKEYSVPTADVLAYCRTLACCKCYHRAPPFRQKCSAQSEWVEMGNRLWSLRLCEPPSNENKLFMEAVSAKRQQMTLSCSYYDACNLSIIKKKIYAHSVDLCLPPLFWVGTGFYTHKIRHILICSSTTNTGPSILETTKSTIEIKSF